MSEHLTIRQEKRLEAYELLCDELAGSREWRVLGALRSAERRRRGAMTESERAAQELAEIHEIARRAAEAAPAVEVARPAPAPRRDPKPKPVSRCGHFGAMALRLEDARDRKDDDQ